MHLERELGLAPGPLGERPVLVGAQLATGPHFSAVARPSRRRCPRCRRSPGTCSAMPRRCPGSAPRPSTRAGDRDDARRVSTRGGAGARHRRRIGIRGIRPPRARRLAAERGVAVRATSRSGPRCAVLNCLARAEQPDQVGRVSERVRDRVSALDLDRGAQLSARLGDEHPARGDRSASRCASRTRAARSLRRLADQQRFASHCLQVYDVYR